MLPIYYHRLVWVLDFRRHSSVSIGIGDRSVLRLRGTRQTAAVSRAHPTPLPPFTVHHLDASDASPVAIEKPLFLHTEKAVNKPVRIIGDTDMQMRWDRVRWQALRNGEEKDAPTQFGDERPEDGVNEGRMAES
jgi:hypothetical protein